ILNAAGIINIVRIKRVDENKNRKRDVLKNRQSDLVRKRIERSGDSKLMLLGINLLLLGKVNAARHKLTAVGEN
ncbi:hypothetical protein Tco_0384709, partial [Tanacetum coccineum]